MSIISANRSLRSTFMAAELLQHLVCVLDWGTWTLMQVWGEIQGCC